MSKGSTHCARRFHDPVSKHRLQLMSKGPQCSEQNNKKCDTATDFPEIIFGLIGINDAGEVHAVVGGEE